MIAKSSSTSDILCCFDIKIKMEGASPMLLSGCTFMIYDFLNLFLQQKFVDLFDKFALG